MSDIPVIPRDVSWLSFNHRVLQEAKNENLPLFERIKFLAIYSSNLGEFFAVRISQHRNLLRIKKKEKKELEIDPKNELKQILEIVKEQQIEFNNIFEDSIIPALLNEKIRLLRRLELSDEQLEYVESYFAQYMLPFVQPVLLIKNKIRPFLNNAALYMVVVMKDKERPKHKEYGIVKIPSDHLNRFVKLPSKDGFHDVIMLDDIVRHSISDLFPGYDIQDTYSIKLTRDAELYIDDEFSGNLKEKVKASLINRNVGPASRLVYDWAMPEEVLEYLQDALELENFDLIPEGRYHNNFDFFSFPDFGKKHLYYPDLPQIPYGPLEQKQDIFEEITKMDHLIMPPFHSYQSVIDFFEQAMEDPDVTHIKIVQYRVAKKSKIMEALKSAAAKGKNVSAFVEVKARFDEETNIKWAEELEKSGVRVHYSFPGIKVHAKIALVRRIERGKPKLYCYFSTGNFHEGTVKIYSDLGIFTANPKITSEVSRIFSVLESGQLPDKNFHYLLVGQFNLKERLKEFVQTEIENAKKGRKARIQLKMNSLHDSEMIDLLYEASMAGVEVQLIIRGICCLVPDDKKYSKNIEAVSIVDRYLEHARIFAFYNNGRERIYISSADWMRRNLNYRIETCVPVFDRRLKKQIKDIWDMQWRDNVKARILDKKLKNKFRKDESDMLIRSQYETYYYFKRREAEFELENTEEELI